MREKLIERLKANKQFKQFALSVAIVLAIIACCFAISKYVLDPLIKNYTLYFNKYKVEVSEINLKSIRSGRR